MLQLPEKAGASARDLAIDADGRLTLARPRAIGATCPSVHNDISANGRLVQTAARKGAGARSCC